MPTDTNTADTRLSEALKHATRLKSLLDDPQPGLHVWVKMYGEEMQALSDFWNLSDGATHVGCRSKVRSKCEKCGVKTNWTVITFGRVAYWCGCD